MKSVVKLGLARLPIAQKITKGRLVVTSMTGNANFTTPNPTLATITTNVNALETAKIAADSGGPDDTANMYAKEAVLDMALKLLSAYVEGIANVNPLNAEAIILSAGMEVKGKGGNVIHDFDVQTTNNPGEVKLKRRGVGRGTYEFQMCTDPAVEANWQTIYRGTRGRITKNGLTSAVKYFFRAVAIDKNGPSSWSDVKGVMAI
jgi:hypothetical protein